MSSQGLRRVGVMVLRFGALYALLLTASVATSLFQQLERPLVAGVDALLAIGSDGSASRRLELVRGEPDWSYELRVERQGEQRQIVRRYHAHAYLVLLFVVGVLATQQIPWRARVVGLVVGGLLSFCLSAGLLISDVLAWEAAAFPEGIPAGGGLVWWARGLDALHRSAGLALLPLLLWLLYLAWAPIPDVGEPPGSHRESV